MTPGNDAGHPDDDYLRAVTDEQAFVGSLDDAVAVFERERPRLMGIGYRILGTVADTEDVLQQTWLRWQVSNQEDVRNAQAFLTTIVTRLALDRLRQLKRRREDYIGSWLPEPVAVDPDPAASVELADSLSLALLVVLETLSPLERAAFVLRDVFGQSYPEVAAVLDRDEPAVRQLVHRARRHVQAGGARFHADRVVHAQVVTAFMTACANADIDALLDVLAPDVVVVSDGGGVAKAHPRPVHGRDKVARLILGITTKIPLGTVYAYERFNGELGVVARVNGHAVTAMAFTVADYTVQSLHVVANPEKLETFDRRPLLNLT